MRATHTQPARSRGTAEQPALTTGGLRGIFWLGRHRTLAQSLLLGLLLTLATAVVTLIYVQRLGLRGSVLEDDEDNPAVPSWDFCQLVGAALGQQRVDQWCRSTGTLDS